MIQSSSGSSTEPSTNISSNPIISPHKSKNPTLILATIAGVLLIFLGGYFYIQTQNKKAALIQQKITPTKTEETKQTSPSAEMNISSWKTYTNTMFDYSINYPSDWTVREFSDPKSGATFRPSNKPDDYQYEYISINRNGKVMFNEQPNLTFEEYVKKAGAEIQNYKEYVSMKKIVTNSNIVGYTATWNIGSESPPRTYFEIPGDNTATIQVALNDEKYIDIYDQMLSSFTFLEKKKKVSNPNLKTYTSSKLGISFTYLEKQDSQEITVKENDNKICVTYDVSDIDCSKGQSVEVFQKGASETLQAAISRLFLVGKDPTRCLVSISDPDNYPPTYVKGEITFPENEEFDMEKMTADTEYCSSDYAQTNGIRYFLEDKIHPTKFLFFSIGQYGISSDENKTWQETVSFE